jgi:hypothetical protein
MKLGGQLDAPVALPPGKNVSGIHWIGGVLRHLVWTIWRRQKYLPLPGIESRFPSRPSRSLDSAMTELS